MFFPLFLNIAQKRLIIPEFRKERIIMYVLDIVLSPRSTTFVLSMIVRLGKVKSLHLFTLYLDDVTNREYDLLYKNKIISTKNIILNATINST